MREGQRLIKRGGVALHTCIPRLFSPVVARGFYRGDSRTLSCQFPLEGTDTGPDGSPEIEKLIVGEG
jgi:hypothetical protein